MYSTTHNRRLGQSLRGSRLRGDQPLVGESKDPSQNFIFSKISKILILNHFDFIVDFFF